MRIVTAVSLSVSSVLAYQINYTVVAVKVGPPLVQTI